MSGVACHWTRSAARSAVSEPAGFAHCAEGNSPHWSGWHTADWGSADGCWSWQRVWQDRSPLAGEWDKSGSASWAGDGSFGAHAGDAPVSKKKKRRRRKRGAGAPSSQDSGSETTSSDEGGDVDDVAEFLRCADETQQAASEVTATAAKEAPRGLEQLIAKVSLLADTVNRIALRMDALDTSFGINTGLMRYFDPAERLDRVSERLSNLERLSGGIDNRCKDMAAVFASKFGGLESTMQSIVTGLHNAPDMTPLEDAVVNVEMTLADQTNVFGTLSHQLGQLWLGNVRLPVTADVGVGTDNEICESVSSHESGPNVQLSQQSLQQKNGLARGCGPRSCPGGALHRSDIGGAARDATAPPLATLRQFDSSSTSSTSSMALVGTKCMQEQPTMVCAAAGDGLAGISSIGPDMTMPTSIVHDSGFGTTKNGLANEPEEPELTTTPKTKQLQQLRQQQLLAQLG